VLPAIAAREARTAIHIDGLQRSEIHKGIRPLYVTVNILLDFGNCTSRSLTG
jgi:hypothetical protein